MFILHSTFNNTRPLSRTLHLTLVGKQPRHLGQHKPLRDGGAAAAVRSPGRSVVDACAGRLAHRAEVQRAAIDAAEQLWQAPLALPPSSRPISPDLAKGGRCRSRSHHHG